MILNAIHHIAIICSDKEAAIHFYHEILGDPLAAAPGRKQTGTIPLPSG